jgi:hypothetical protein
LSSKREKTPESFSHFRFAARPYDVENSTFLNTMEILKDHLTTSNAQLPYNLLKGKRKQDYGKSK